MRVGPNGRLPADYLLAVSVYDKSLWLIYNVWNYYDRGDDVDDDEDEEDPHRPLGFDWNLSHPFRPDSDPNWAKLPGLLGRMLMVKIANHVRTWHFGDPTGEEMLMQQGWTEKGVVPTFRCARVAEMGKVISTLSLRGL